MEVHVVEYWDAIRFSQSVNFKNTRVDKKILPSQNRFRQEFENVGTSGYYQQGTTLKGTISV
jgi:hypothetical protein